MNNEPAHLGGLIEQVFLSLGLGNKFYGWRIANRWSEIVGGEIAKHSRAVKFADGTIFVVVEKDAWRQELEMQLESILNKIRILPGGKAVQKIVLKAGSFAEFKDEQNGG
jgi:hypothetical protein